MRDVALQASDIVTRVHSGQMDKDAFGKSWQDFKVKFEKAAAAMKKELDV